MSRAKRRERKERAALLRKARGGLKDWRRRVWLQMSRGGRS